MKYLPYVLILLFLSACAARGPIKVPQFSSLSFTGNAYSGDLPMPIQGALTHKGDELKFALAARQGVVLGYGTIDAKTGKVNLMFSQSSGVKRLLKGIGEALMELLPVIEKGEHASEHWIIESDGKMQYKTPKLDLTAWLKGADIHQ